VAVDGEKTEPKGCHWLAQICHKAVFTGRFIELNQAVQLKCRCLALRKSRDGQCHHFHSPSIRGRSQSLPEDLSSN